MGPCADGRLVAGPDDQVLWASRESLSQVSEGTRVGSVIKKRRKRMAKKKHRKLLKKTRIQRRNKKK
ncbi:hypothetical protein ABH926_008074 [Catenulispora sp. GP43]